MTDNLEGRFKEAYEFISSLNKEAFKDKFLISNQVLSKNPFSSAFIRRFVNGEEAGGPVFYLIPVKIAAYYFKSFCHFICYLFKFLEYRLSGYSFKLPPDTNELIVVDTFFLMHRINRERAFNEFYFPGLEDLLKKLGKQYLYLPYFTSPANNKSAFELYSTLRALRKEKIPLVLEFGLLKAGDVLSVLHFILAYPFSVLNFIRKIGSEGWQKLLVKHELISGLGEVTFYNYLRYLVGRRLAELPYKKIKVISWYENLPINKNFYLGLRVCPAKVKIYGAQLLLPLKNSLFTIADENEKDFGIVPDKIIVNGKAYIPKDSPLNYALGPSLRFAKIFNTSIRKEQQRNILVLLPYFKNDLKAVLSILNKADIGGKDIIIKAHPATSLKDYKYDIPSGSKVSKEDTYSLLGSAKIVIGSGSGTLLESAALGIPAILVNTSVNSLYNNPLPDYGRGVIWDEASTPEALHEKTNKFERESDGNATRIQNIAREYRDMFFNPPTEENIVRAFDLK